MKNNIVITTYRIKITLFIGVLISTIYLATPSLAITANKEDEHPVFIPIIWHNGLRQSATSVANPKPSATATRIPTSRPTATATPRPTTLPTPTNTPVVDTKNNPCNSANQSRQQRDMILLITSKPLQMRPVFQCNPILMEQAMRKAKDMIERNYYGHVDIDGYGMNYFLRRAGYPLQSYYLTNKDANNVEALAAGPDFGEAGSPFQGFLDSPKHRSQILGLSAGWLAQDEYGVGYAHSINSTYENYWVVLTAKQGN